MKPSEFLSEARRLIEKPEQLARGAYATTASGAPIPLNSSQASCFCSHGALLRTQLRLFGAQLPVKSQDVVVGAYVALNAVSRHDIAHMNDSSTHEEVLATWDKAINLAQQREQNEPNS